MPVEINGQKYYRTLEVCSKTGISRATLFRWLSKGIIFQSSRDRRGWRLFTEQDLINVNREVSKINIQAVVQKGLE
jgi:DNA-binding transcriptional MerR regulator